MCPSGQLRPLFLKTPLLPPSFLGLEKRTVGPCLGQNKQSEHVHGVNILLVATVGRQGSLGDLATFPGPMCSGSAQAPLSPQATLGIRLCLLPRLSLLHLSHCDGRG